MFGKKRIQELESKLYEADDNISKLTREKTDLEERLNIPEGEGSDPCC